MLNIIVNPATGAGKGKKIFEKIRPLFDATGVSYHVYYSGRGKRVKDIVERLTDPDLNGKKAVTEPGSHKSADDRFTDIVIIGGDGSMNGAVNGIKDFDRTRLGFIPAGSGNDLARDMDIPKDIKELVTRIAKRKVTRRMDIGLAKTEGTERLFNISSGMGFDADTCYYVDRSAMKGFLNRIGLGKLVYIMVAIRLILKNKKFYCEIETAEGQKKVYPECLFAVGMNHRYEGGGFMFAPEAEDTDSKLDFCVVNGVGPLRFMFMFPFALSGKHTRFHQIEVFRTKYATVRTDAGQHIHADGDADLKSKELELSIYKKKLNLFI